MSFGPIPEPILLADMFSSLQLIPPPQNQNHLYKVKPAHPLTVLQSPLNKRTMKEQIQVLSSRS